MEALVQLATGQSGALCALIGLLIDNGTLSRGEVIERFEAAAAEAKKSDAGAIGALPLQSVCDYLRGKYGPISRGTTN